MIERRILLTALAATAAMPAFAQTARKDSDAASGGQPAAMGAAEQKHLTDTMAAGAMSLASSRVALKKVRNEDIKQFAEFEVAEQETIADVLMSVKDPSKASGKVTKPSDAEVRQLVSKDDAAALEKMEQLDGKAFEQAYVKAQTDGHEKLLTIQETYLANGKLPAHLAIAKLARGQIKEHLTLLEDLGDASATTGQSKSAK